MVYGKVNEKGIPLKPKRGWYKIQVDLGTLRMCNPHRKGTKAYQKYEEKFLKQPAETRVRETTAFLYQAWNGSWGWDHCVYLTNYAGYHIKVVGAKRIPGEFQL